MTPAHLPFDADTMLQGLRAWVECESPTWDAGAVDARARMQPPKPCRPAMRSIVAPMIAMYRHVACCQIEHRIEHIEIDSLPARGKLMAGLLATLE